MWNQVRFRANVAVVGGLFGRMKKRMRMRM